MAHEPPETSSNLPNGQGETTSGDDKEWELVTGADKVVSPRVVRRRTTSEFNFYIGWRGWKTKVFGWNAWLERDVQR